MTTRSIVREDGFVGCFYAPSEFEREVLPHIEWPLPSDRPALAQGAIAGVPAKIWFTEGSGSPGTSGALVITWAAYAVELQDRLR